MNAFTRYGMRGSWWCAAIEQTRGGANNNSNARINGRGAAAIRSSASAAAAGWAEPGFTLIGGEHYDPCDGDEQPRTIYYGAVMLRHLSFQALITDA